MRKKLLILLIPLLSILFAQNIQAPHVENFDAMTPGANSLPQNGWTKIVNNPTFATASVTISTTAPNSYPNTSRLYTNSNPDAEILLVSPRVTNIDECILSFRARIGGSNISDPPVLMVGHITNPEDASTFQEIEIVRNMTLDYAEYSVSFIGYDYEEDARYYIAFKHGIANATRAILIDDINLSIASVGPEFESSTESIGFGQIDVGQNSSSRSFQITNTGIGNLVINALTITGSDAQHFSINDQPTGYPASIPSGQSISISLGFNPLSTGEKTAILEVDYRDLEDQVFELTLSGEGIIRPTGSSHLDPIVIDDNEFSMSGIINDFGDDYEATWVTPTTNYLGGFDIVYQINLDEDVYLSCDVEVTNTYGGVMLVDTPPNAQSPAPIIKSVAADFGNGFTNFPLPAGTYYVIVATFAGPPYVTDVLFNFNYLAIPAGATSLVTTPASHDYAYVPVGRSETKSFQLANSGGGTIQINSIELTHTGNSQFSLNSDIPSYPHNLSVGQSSNFSVTYQSSHIGAFETSVVVNYDINSRDGVQRSVVEIPLNVISYTEFAGGTGTESDPFLISAPYHVNSLRYYLGSEHEDKHYLQTTDLNFDISPYNTGGGWEPIGHFYSDTNMSAFMGNYNGNNHNISNLYINRTSSNHVGLFGVMAKASVKNLSFSSVNIKGQVRAGALAGYIHPDFSEMTIIRGCSVLSGTVSAYSFAGALIGWNSYANVTNSFSLADVALLPDHAQFEEDAKLGFGGLIGANVSHSVVEACFSKGNISGWNGVGGLIGYQSYATVKNSFSRASVTGSGDFVGGLVGGNLFFANLERCFSTGRVTALPGRFAGGLLGSQMNNSNTVSSFWDIETSGMATSAGIEQGKTTMELTYPYANTYLGWNFSTIWQDDIQGEINDRYPMLYWQSVAPPVAPLAPQINIMITNNQPNLIWNSVPGADYYNIYRSVDPNVADWGSPWAITDQTSIQLPPADGNVYFFKVSSVKVNP